MRPVADQEGLKKIPDFSAHGNMRKDPCFKETLFLKHRAGHSIMTQHDELNDHHHNRNVAAVRKALPKSYARWGKLRIEPGGDIISTASILDTDDASARRDNTFVRVRSVYLYSSGLTHATVAV